MPWIWKPTFLDAWPEIDLALIRLGFHLAYTDVLDFYGSEDGVRHGRLFYDEMQAAGLHRRFGFLALSRGGLFAFRYAAAHPGQVNCIYGDAPVCHVGSWPAGRGKGEPSPEAWAQLLRSHKLSEDEALADSFQPLHNLGPLVDATIPILLVSGDADTIVPLEENSEKLVQNYRTLGGEARLIVKPGMGHHPHGLEDGRPVIDFISQHAGVLLPRSAEPGKVAQL